MAKTAFNPITTKWRGAVGGFRYSIVRGKQVIAQRPSAVKNPRSDAQMKVRATFKLSSQFSALWASIIDAFLAKKMRDSVLSRALATKLAYRSSALDNQGIEAKVSLPNFVAALNSQTTPEASNFTLNFGSMAQTITGVDGTMVAYKVVAFNEAGYIIGTYETVLEMNGQEQNITLPATLETPARYDIMAFEMVDSESSMYTHLTNMTGDYQEAIVSNLYTLLASESTMSNVTIHSMVAASTLA